MIKRAALPVLALLFSANASEILEKHTQKAKVDAEIAKVRHDVEKIAQA
jgi:hypothetical protein